jgi:signal transduction histidine kinase
MAPAGRLSGVSLALPSRIARSAGVRGWPRLLLLYGVVFPPGAVLITLAFWPMWQDFPLLALGNEVLSLALLAAAILLLDEPAQQALALMLAGSSALLTAGWLNSWQVGPLPLISVPASPLGIVLASWAMFRYPNAPREMRTGRRFFVTVAAWFLAGQLVYIGLSRPEWNGFPRAAWWPSVHPDRPLFVAAEQVVAVSGIVFAAAYMLLWIRRWRSAQGISRRLAIPLAVAASVVAVAQIAELAAALTPAGDRRLELIYTVESYVQVGVPVAFLVSVMRRRFARTRIADLLLHLRGPTTAGSVTAALRAVFEDPALEVLDWAPGTQARRDDRAPEAPGPPAAGGRGARLMLPITSSAGEQLAVIVADPSLSPHDDLVRAAIAASAFALENAQLEAALRAQLQEVRDSRLRIIEAGMKERLRLERDLHDGTQQRLLALKIMLAAVEGDVTDAGARAVLSRVRGELGEVLDGLRDLAHGIHPAVLTQFGLDQAITSMAERYTVPIDVRLPPGRFGDPAELTAYFVIAEAVTNAIKHAGARRISVRGRRSGDVLEITVTDDGKGGAWAAAGTGLGGVIDRVRGVGGEAELDSRPGQGTTIRAQIPCA